MEVFSVNSFYIEGAAKKVLLYRRNNPLCKKKKKILLYSILVLFVVLDPCFVCCTRSLFCLVWVRGWLNILLYIICIHNLSIHLMNQDTIIGEWRLNMFKYNCYIKGMLAWQTSPKKKRSRAKDISDIR